MIAWIQTDKRALILTFLAAFLVSSCSTIGNSFEFNRGVSEYAESLFKRQNRVTQQVMMLFEEDLSFFDEEKLSRAELQMHDACHLLNEYANREIDGEAMSLFFRRRVQSSLKRCDESVGYLELIFSEVDEAI